MHLESTEHTLKLAVVFSTDISVVSSVVMQRLSFVLVSHT